MASDGHSDYSCAVLFFWPSNAESPFQPIASLWVERAAKEQVIMITKQPVSVSVVLLRVVMWRHLQNKGPLERCDKKSSMLEHWCVSYLWQSPSCCQIPLIKIANRWVTWPSKTLWEQVQDALLLSCFSCLDMTTFFYSQVHFNIGIQVSEERLVQHLSHRYLINVCMLIGF